MENKGWQWAWLVILVTTNQSLAIFGFLLIFPQKAERGTLQRFRREYCWDSDWLAGIGAVSIGLTWAHENTSFSHTTSQGIDGKNPEKCIREPCWQGLNGLAGPTPGKRDRNELGAFSDSPVKIFSPLARSGHSGASPNTCFSEHKQKQHTSHPTPCACCPSVQENPNLAWVPC